MLKVRHTFSGKTLFLLILSFIISLEFIKAQPVPIPVNAEEIYKNPLSSLEDLKDIRIESSKEGQPEISFHNGKMILKSDVHFLMWFPVEFPENTAITWEFMPKVDDGLAMVWFSATGRNGEDLFDKSLQKRTGNYPQYHSGDINAYHLSYFRRNPWDDPTMNTVNLRKSYGNELVAMAANPIPNVEVEKVMEKLDEPYIISLIKNKGRIDFWINDLLVLQWKDDDPYRGGKIGFRQMANLKAEYSNLKVYRLEGD